MNENNKKPNQEIKDSGSMQEFQSGAHRDASTSSKGDFSLVPLEYAAMVMEGDPVVTNIAEFMEKRDIQYLAEALKTSLDTVPVFRYDEILEEMKSQNIEMRVYTDDKDKRKACYAHMMLEVAKIYFDGGAKYGRHNWKLSMPVYRYIDSGTRHYMKSLRGDIDEPHYRGFVWNLLCAMWTAEHFPEMNFKEEPERNPKK